MRFKSHHICFLIILLLPCAIKAQGNDSLVIQFKNGKTIKIALESIQKIIFDTLKSSVNEKNLSGSFQLLPSFPNPSQRAVSIPFTLAVEGKVEILIHDLRGIIIRTFEMPNAQIGRNQIEWDGLDEDGVSVSSGEYFYEIKFKNEVQIKRGLILK